MPSLPRPQTGRWLFGPTLRAAARRVNAILVGIVLSTAACAHGERVPTIQSLLSAPDRYDGLLVLVRGTVENAVKLPLIDQRMFTLRDSTGEIAVITTEKPPTVNSEIVVTGVFSTIASANGVGFGSHITVGSGAKPSHQ